MDSPSEWYIDNFLISTNASLIQPAAVNEAFGSDLIHWARTMDEKLLKKMLDNSLCFGVYALPTSSAEIAGPHTFSIFDRPTDIGLGRGNPRQIGLARLITDEVSFAYVTDVYILEEHQGKGLGKFLIKCINDTISSWPEFRRVLLITSGANKFYEEMLGMKDFEQGKNGFTMMTRKGSGAVIKDV